MPDTPRELSPDELDFHIEGPAPAAVAEDLKAWAAVGQPRAVRALEMGISIRAKGYNLFVAGDSGTGRHTAVTDILEKHRRKNGSLRDIAYVQDFDEPEKPRALTFPEGTARAFRDDVKALIDRFKDRVSRDMDGEVYKNRRDRLIADTERRENKILADFETRLGTAGFRTVQTADELEGQATDIAPVVDGEPVLFEELQDRVSAGDIPESFWNETRERYFAYMDEMNRIYRDLRGAREELDNQIGELKTETIREGVNEEVAEFTDHWDDGPITAYLEKLREDVLDNPDWFVAEAVEETTPDFSLRYGVNIVVDRHGVDRLPVIKETNPTKANLFGAIEARYDITGELRTNMMMIRAGSLLQADGGFLILQAEDVFAKEGLWPEFKRALQTREVEPEIQSTPLGPLPILMKPEPVKVDTKVILIGPARLYETLCIQDEEFRKLFKVVAEFSPVMPRNDDTEREYAVFIRSLIEKEGLRPATPGAIREIIRYGVRLAERRDRLSSRFSLIGDLIREANYGAGRDGKEEIDVAAIKGAMETRVFLGNLPEEVQNEQIKEGILLISVQGSAVGVVNGLAVLERGFYAFGTPLRITASVSPGKEGVVNIEREAGLSGELHDKGVLILEGYLRSRYSRRQPLGLTASVAVEQSYYEIEGDSASAAELVALLSAIAEIPLRQDVAVTGAVNQQGWLQPVGGIPEKIEGFFNACTAAGLTGTQGVLIPRRNIESVILSDRVNGALTAGSFHIWAAENIDDVLAVLCGMNPGKERRNGGFEPHSVNGRIWRNLREISDRS